MVIEDVWAGLICEPLGGSEFHCEEDCSRLVGPEAPSVCTAILVKHLVQIVHAHPPPPKEESVEAPDLVRGAVDARFQKGQLRVPSFL